MYQYIKGKITEIHPDFITIENNGIGFLIVVPNPYRFESQLQQESYVFIEQVVREDKITLYGFLDKKEKEMFQALLKVTGIGPKSALAILATSETNEIISAIENEDETFLQKFPGIGKKTSRQIILDLKGKLGSETLSHVTVEEKTNDKIVQEALETLGALGYSKRELKALEKHLSDKNLETVEEAVKSGLRYIVD